MKTYIDTILNEEVFKEQAKKLVHFKGSYVNESKKPYNKGKQYNDTINETSPKIGDTVQFTKNVSAEVEIEEEGEGDEPIYKTNIEEIRTGARGNVTYVDEANGTVDVEFKNSTASGIALKNIKVVEK